MPEIKLIRKPVKTTPEVWGKVEKLAKSHKYPMPTEQQAGMIIEEYFERNERSCEKEGE